MRSAAGQTGLTEKRLKALGLPYRRAYLHPSQHAGYYPGAYPVDIKLLFSPEGKIYGVQATGTEGVDVVGVPGGFSFGDYLRCGAIAAQSPISAAIRAHADKGGYVLSDCTGEAQITFIATGSEVKLALDAQAAPLTVNNFVFLARAGFFDGLTFHRVEPDFVIQGGDPLGTGEGGPGYMLPAEIGLRHEEGSIAMARLPDQGNPRRMSSGSQFYITLAATSQLDGSYTVFGKVTSGMDVVKSIAVGDVIESVVISER